MPSYEVELLAAARAVARLQAKRRQLRKQLKQVAADLRHEQKILRAIASRNDDRRPDVLPSRIFGDGVGRVVGPVERATNEGSVGTGLSFVDQAKTGTE